MQRANLKSLRRKHITDEKELEKNRNNLRRFQEQVPGADPVNEKSQWNTVSVNYIGFGQPQCANPNAGCARKHARIAGQTLKAKLQMKNRSRKCPQGIVTGPNIVY